MIRDISIPEDVAAITAIYNHYVLHSTATFDEDIVTADMMEKQILHITRHYPFFVYEDHQAVVGYCYVHNWKTKDAYRTTVETTVYIHPQYCGKGIGEKLMAYLMDVCRQRKFHAVIACITYPNDASIRLHEKMGFEKRSHFHEVGMKFNKWLDIVDMELIL